MVRKWQCWKSSGLWTIHMTIQWSDTVFEKASPPTSFGVAPHTPQFSVPDLVWSWFRCCFTFILCISLFTVFICLPLPEGFNHWVRTCRKSMCLESYTKPLWEVQQSNRKTRRGDLPRFPLSTPISRNPWLLELALWLSGDPRQVPGGKYHPLLVRILLSERVWEAASESLFSTSAQHFWLLRRPRNRDLLGLKLQTLPHLLYKGFFFFFFKTQVCDWTVLSPHPRQASKIIKFSFWSLVQK